MMKPIFSPQPVRSPKNQGINFKKQHYELVRMPSIEEILTMRITPDSKQNFPEHQLRDVLADIGLPTLTTAPSIEELQNFPDIPLVRNASSTDPMSLMTILEKDLGAGEGELLDNRVESIDLDTIQEINEDQRPASPAVQLMKGGTGLFGNLMKTNLRKQTKEIAGQEALSYSDAEEDEPSELYKLILPLSKSSKSLYSPDSMMLYFYLEKYFISLIQLLNPESDKELIQKPKAAEVESPMLAFQTRMDLMIDSVMKKRKEFTELLPKVTERLRKKHRIWISELLTLNLIQKGPQGETYRVFDPVTKKNFIMKKIFKPKDWTPLAFEMQAVIQLCIFLHLEFEALESNLLTVYAMEYHKSKNEYLIVYEAGLGSLADLKDFYTRQNKIIERELFLVIIEDIVTQIRHLEKSQIYHRDIRPENILVTEDLRFKLTDFACACKAEGRGPRSLGISGTVFYMAPEMREGLSKGKQFAEYDPYVTDLYSLGITVLGLLTTDTSDVDKRIKVATQKYGEDYIKDVISLLIDREWPKIASIRTLKDFSQILNQFRDFKEMSLIEQLYKEDKFLAEKRIVKMNVKKFKEFLESKEQEGRDPRLLLNLLQLNKETGHYLNCYNLLAELKPMLQKKDKEFCELAIRIKAEFAALQGNYDHARKKFNKLMRHHMEKRREEDLFMADIHIQFSDLIRDNGIYVSAFKQLKTAFKIRLRFYDYQSPRIHELLEKVGLIFQGQGKYEEARRIYLKTLKRYISYYGNCHPLVGLILARLGKVSICQQKWNEALSDFKNALQNYKNWAGGDSMEVAGVYGHIANLYRHQGETNKALKYYMKSLNIYSKFPDCSEAAVLCEHVGAIFRNQKKYDQTLKYFDEALQIKKKVYGPANGNLVTAYCLHGDQLKIMGRYSEAMRDFATALDMALKLFTKHDNRLGEIFYLIGENYGLEEDFNKSISSFLKTAEIFEHDPIKGREKLAKTYLYIGKYYEESGKNEQAYNYYQKSLNALLKGQDENFKIQRGIARKCIARAARKLNYYSIALSNMYRAIELVCTDQKYIDSKYLEIAKMYDFVGEVHNILDNRDKACVAFQIALNYKMRKGKLIGKKTSENGIGLLKKGEEGEETSL